MTTIYIITEGDYSDYHIEAVCSSLEKCQEWMLNELNIQLKSKKKLLAECEEELKKPYEQRGQHPNIYDRKYWLEQYYTDEKLQEQIKDYKFEIQNLEDRIKKGSWVEKAEYGDYDMCEYRVEEYIIDRMPEP